MDIYHHIFSCTPDGLLVVGADARISELNPQAGQMFGYEREELLGQTIETLVPARVVDRHLVHRSRYLEAPGPRPMGAGKNLFGRRRDGREFPVDVMLSPLASSGGTSILCVVRDVTERWRAEQQILDSLREKEVLLKEIHHRVKNNLAVIGSLFYLQSGYTHDEATLQILQESQDRVRSMALVHESLYAAGNLADVDFAEYARALSTQLLQTYCVTQGRVKLELELEPVTLAIDLAVPCGLVLNELVTNGLKHAFPDGRAGIIRVRLARTAPGECALAVEDDGVGFRAGPTDGAPETLGLRLVRLLTKQISGTFSHTARERGTEARLHFRHGPDA